jgi:hypothetical protein
MSVNEIKTIAPKAKLLLICTTAPVGPIKLTDQVGLCEITSSSSVMSSDGEIQEIKCKI